MYVCTSIYLFVLCSHTQTHLFTHIEKIKVLHWNMTKTGHHHRPASRYILRLEIVFSNPHLKIFFHFILFAPRTRTFGLTYFVTYIRNKVIFVCVNILICSWCFSKLHPFMFCFCNIQVEFTCKFSYLLSNISSTQIYIYIHT